MVHKKVIWIGLVSVILNSCVAIYTNDSLGLKGEKIRNPVSFTEYLYSRNGEKVKAGSEQLKIIKHFEFVVNKDVATGDKEDIDLSSKLDDVIKNAGGDGIVNLEFTKPLVGGDSKGFFKIILGQVGGGALVTIGLFNYASQENNSVLKGTLWTIGGIAAWLASTFFIKDNVKVLIRGDVVKWAKS